MFCKMYFLIYCLVANYNTVPVFTEPQLDWWQTSVFYQIYPRSFKDSNGDGIGDLKGIEQQVSYFKESGIDVVWLSPIYKSPMMDAGYDISDFTEIDPVFGTMADFDSLLKTFNSTGIKVILDLVPNHSSDECEWFQKSVERIDPYTDYYVWRDPIGWTNSTKGSEPIPPNNWISVFHGSAWEYNEKRKQFYLHEFLVQQPDFNYRSPAFVEEMKNVIRFWLDKGVDGFRVDSVMFLFENNKFPDEPVISNHTINGNLAYSSLRHIHTTDQPETYDMLSQFRKLLDSYKQKDGKTRILMTEAYTSLENTIRYYGNETNPMAQIPFNFQLITNLNFTANASTFKSVIDSWMHHMPSGQWANWVLGNHDNPRITTRFDPQMVDGINMLLLLMPGTGIIFNGDELGMLDTKIRWDQTNDVSAKNLGEALYATVSRDPERTPFQWNSSPQAGFTNATTTNTWLPVNPNYYYLNYEKQKVEPRSHWNVFRNVTQLRKTKAFQHGEFSTYTFSDWVFGFVRNTSDEMYIVLMNLNNQEEYVNLQEKMPNLTAPALHTVFVSVNSEYDIGDVLTSGQSVNENHSNDTNHSERVGFSMRPNSAIILQVPLKNGETAGYGSGASRLHFPAFPIIVSIGILMYFNVITCSVGVSYTRM